MGGVFSSRKDNISFLFSLLMRYIYLLPKYIGVVSLTP